MVSEQKGLENEYRLCQFFYIRKCKCETHSLLKLCIFQEVNNRYIYLLLIIVILLKSSN